jgi:excisionase family DNA binding protein
VNIGGVVGQVRGVLAERVVVSTNLDPFLSVAAAANYLDLSSRTIRGYLEMPPDEALPCYRLPGGGKIVIRRSELDHWMQQFRARGRPSLVRAMAAVGLASRD